MYELKEAQQIATEKRKCWYNLHEMCLLASLERAFLEGVHGCAVLRNQKILEKFEKHLFRYHSP